MEWKYIKNKNSYGIKINLNDNLRSFVRAQVSSFYLVAVWIFAENSNLERKNNIQECPPAAKTPLFDPSIVLIHYRPYFQSVYIDLQATVAIKLPFFLQFQAKVQRIM